jgi:hypothetical protein
MAKNAKDGLSVAERNRRIRQETTREQLAAKGLIQHVLDISNKLADFRNKIPPEHVTRLKIAMDIKLKLINKYLPDLKQTELIGDPNQPLKTEQVITFVGVNANSN